jgi:ABC-type uncharacterized transport system ATPase subunit
MKLVKDENGCYKTVTNEDIFFDSYKDELVTVFENGEILVEYNFDEIRERANI